MAKTEVIKMSGTSEKWLKLMLHLQNSLVGTYQLTFRDVEAARNAAKSIKAVMDKDPTWFQLVSLQRGCNIYIIKTQFVQKVVICDENH